jgi:hypothetical protein
MECDPADRMELVLVPMKQGELLNIFWNISGRTCSEPSLKKPRKCNTSTNTRSVISKRGSTTIFETGNSKKRKDDNLGRTPSDFHCASGKNKPSKQKLILTLILLLSVFNSNSYAYNYNFASQPITNEKFQVLFEEIGQMSSSVQYVFSPTNLNLTRLENSIDTYRENISSFIKQVQNIPAKRNNYKQNDLKERMINNLNIHLDDLDTQKARINDVKGNFEQVSVECMHKQKQKKFMLQMLFGALGTFMGMFTLNQCDKLQASLNNERVITERLIELLNNQG